MIKYEVIHTYKQKNTYTRVVKWTGYNLKEIMKLLGGKCRVELQLVENNKITLLIHTGKDNYILEEGSFLIHEGDSLLGKGSERLSRLYILSEEEFFDHYA